MAIYLAAEFVILGDQDRETRTIVALEQEFTRGDHPGEIVITPAKQRHQRRDAQLVRRAGPATNCVPATHSLTSTVISFPELDAGGGAVPTSEVPPSTA